MVENGSGFSKYLAAAKADRDTQLKTQQDQQQPRKLDLQTRKDQAKNHPDYQRVLEMVNSPLLREALYHYWKKFKGVRYDAETGLPTSTPINFEVEIGEDYAFLSEESDDIVNASFSVSVLLGQYCSQEYGGEDSQPYRVVNNSRLVIDFVWHGTEWSQVSPTSSSSDIFRDYIPRPKGLYITFDGHELHSLEELIKQIAEEIVK